MRIGIGLLVGLAACGWAPSLTPASASLQRLHMVVADPVITTTDSDCSEDMLRRTFPNALKSALLNAGYPVGAEGGPYDVKWTMRVNISDCLGSQDHRALVGMVELTAEGADGMLFSGKSTQPIGGPSLQENWAPGVVNQFTAAPAVLHFAMRPRPSADAVASLPPTPRSSPPPAVTGRKLRSGPIRGNAYALVVGVEKYRDVPPPLGARADAQHFADLAKTTLGVPADHVRLALDDRATKADLERELEWIRTNAPAGSRIYFFYAGHGAPDAAQGTPYLLPYDGDPKYVTTSALPLASVLDTLSKSKAQEVIAFVDACFSGAGGRSVLPTGARPLVRVRETTASSAPAKLALLTSAGGSEISGPTLAGGEGLFTHMLVEAIGNGSADIDGDGNISLAEVATWVKPRVAREASQDRREQNPTLTAGAGLGDPAMLIVAGGLAP